MAAIDPTFVLANQLEAALWIVIAIAMAATAARRAHLRADCAVSAIAFALFGLSDLVETTTGAWWRPWWLLAWKLACAFAFVVLLQRFLTRRKAASGSSTASRRPAPEQNPYRSGSR